MKRRTVLGATGALAATGLSGCLDAFQEHFTGEVSTPIPIQILNESDQSHNLQLEAYERESDRHSYEESYTVTPGEQVKPPNLRGVEQRFQATLLEDGDETLTQSGVITPETQLVRVVLRDDDLLLEITESEDAGNESDGNGNESDGNGNDGNGESTGDDESGENGSDGASE